MSPLEWFVAAAFVLVAVPVMRKFTFSLPWAVVLPLIAVGMYGLMRYEHLSPVQALTTAIFLFAFTIIASERIHRTKVALAAAALMLILGLVDQHTALHGHGDVAGVDWNTLLLLIGMMIVVNELRRTGVFEWTAIKAAKLAGGNPLLVLIYLCVATAVLSAFLDNVTTVLLFVPITILICESMGLAAAPYIIFIVLASNIGGTATLIGDPPNIMVGSSARLGFLDFVMVDGPIALAGLVALVGAVAVVMRRRACVTPAARAEVMAFDESRLITNRRLLRRYGVVAAFILAGFFLHGSLGLEPATIALAGAAAALLLRRGDLEESLQEVEWPTIFFYLGLFIMVGALVEVGVVGIIAQGVINVACGGSVSDGLSLSEMRNLTIGILWLSAISAGLMGNVALVPVMNAVIHNMAMGLHPSPETASFFEVAHAPAIYPLWWAVSIGACFGGNFTLVGAGSNLVAAGIAERSHHPISFVRFLKYGVPFSLVTLLMASAYLWLRFLT